MCAVRVGVRCAQCVWECARERCASAPSAMCVRVGVCQRAMGAGVRCAQCVWECAGVCAVRVGERDGRSACGSVPVRE